MICKKCGQEIPAGAKFCTSCGEKIEETSEFKFCPKCGEECKKDAKFCTKCGASFDNNTSFDNIENKISSLANKPAKNKILQFVALGVAGLLLIFILFKLGSCIFGGGKLTESKAEDIVEEFVDALFDFDLKKMAKYTVYDSESLEQILDKGDMREVKALKNLKDSMGDLDYDIEIVPGTLQFSDDKKEAWADFEMKIKYKMMGEEYKDSDVSTIRFIKKNNKWLISLFENMF